MSQNLTGIIIVREGVLYYKRKVFLSRRSKHPIVFINTYIIDSVYFIVYHYLRSIPSYYISYNS